jgi:hypothetical protein
VLLEPEIQRADAEMGWEKQFGEGRIGAIKARLIDVGNKKFRVVSEVGDAQGSFEQNEKAEGDAED